MARGVTQDQVTRAADTLLARGERPTIERVRAELGTGSPNTLLRLLEVWWADLAKRLAGETRLPGLPADVVSAFKTAWAVAADHAAVAAEQSLALARQGIEQEKASLAADRQRWSADLDSARAEVAGAKDAQAVAEQRLTDHQRLVDQMQIELRDVKAQRDKLQEQADILVQDKMRLGDKLEKQQKEQAAERASTTAHVRSIEDRAHAEVDRTREEIKGLRLALAQAERASQTARDTAAQEHKEHVGQLRSAEREASAQHARAEALEQQLKGLRSSAQLISPATRYAGSNKGIKSVDPLAELREDFEALVARMQTPQARAAGRALFAATGKELGEHAQAHARATEAPRRTKKGRNSRGSTALATQRAGARLGAERRGKGAAKNRLLDRMMESTARASAAIDDAVAYVESSNRKLARVKAKKKRHSEDSVE